REGQMKRSPRDKRSARDPETRTPRLSRRSLVGLGAGAGTAVLSSRLLLAQGSTPEAAGTAPVGHHHGHDAQASPHVTHNGTPAALVDATPVATPFDGVTGQPLVQPEIRASSGGVLETQLEAKLSPTTVAGRDVVSTV